MNTVSTKSAAAQETRWNGTPVPPPDDAIAPTAALEAVAKRIWWHGPPRIALRNANAFIWQVIDYGDDQDVEICWAEIERERWIKAIKATRPGRVSRRATLLWRTRLGLPTKEVRENWPRKSHRNDIAPLAGASRKSMYERHRLARERARAPTTTEPDVARHGRAPGL